MIKLYSYKKCSTCIKAIKIFKEKKIAFTEIAIRETPPTKNELKQMLDAYDGDLKKLFNVSGQDYRSLDIKTTLPTLSTDDALDLLSTNGNLIKRPFIIGPSIHVVGLKDILDATQ
jgi:arsenate reductase